MSQEEILSTKLSTQKTNCVARQECGKWLSGFEYMDRRGERHTGNNTETTSNI
eukprot:m.366329 g.366329  ORF g.366329 m.366329 type:complete len:53 (+) comp16659_c0_seq1:1825-1983(+)